LSPSPSAGAAWVAKGLATATSRKLKKTTTRPTTGTTHTSTSRPTYRSRSTAAAPKPVRTRSHRSRDPSWPPQKAEIVYIVGNFRLVWSAT
jgi:hypothetical protein